MRLVKTLIIAVFFLLAITFALQNQQLVTINYYELIPPFSVPLFLIVFFSVLLGILVAGFGDIYVRYSLRIRARKCEKQLKACQKELEALKKAQETDASEKREEARTAERGQPESSAPAAAQGAGPASPVKDA